MADVDDKTAPESGSATTFRDEEGRINAPFVEYIVGAMAADDAARLRELTEDLHEADIGALIEALDAEDRPRLVRLLTPGFDFKALTEIDSGVREKLLRELPNETVVEGLRELDIDDAVYILEDLDDEAKAAILDRLPAPERVALERSLDYPDDSAGRRMQTEFVAVPPFWSVGQVIDFMRESTDLPDKFYEIFVVDPGYRLKGSVELDTLLRTRRPVRVSDIASEDVHRVRAADDQEDVARLLKRYNMVSVPVVDDAERLVGVVMVDDVVDVMEEEAEEDLKALGGVRREEEFSDNVWTITRSRFTWLFLNLITAFVAASVLGLFEGQLQKMVALAVLAPIVASQGGNAATQTMTVAVRALATRELTRANMWRIVLREVFAALLNGFGFAVITGVLAGLWFQSRGLGLVIGAAMVVNLVAGALGGILVPLTLERFRADPAVSSGVFVTTVTDVVGFFAFLGIATLWFGLL
jgi:magnesium transporter